jgi:hypothetical protein
MLGGCVDLRGQDGERVFYTVDTHAGGTATSFRSEVGVSGLREALPRIQRSITTEVQYIRAVESCSRRPKPAGAMLSCVCRDQAPSRYVFICDKCVTFSAQAFADTVGNAKETQVR